MVVLRQPAHSIDDALSASPFTTIPFSISLWPPSHTMMSHHSNRSSHALLDEEAAAADHDHYDDRAHLLNDLKRQPSSGPSYDRRLLTCECGRSTALSDYSRRPHSSSSSGCSVGSSSGSSVSRFYSRPLAYLRPPKRRLSRFQWIAAIVALIYVALAINTLRNPSPPYDILAPSRYRSVMEASARRLLPRSQSSALLTQLHDALGPLANGTPAQQRAPAAPLPTTLWQTEKTRTQEVDEAEAAWTKAGTVQRFLDDQGGADYVDSIFNGSEIRTVFDELPAGVLKPDMLRYLLLLNDGGIYSDVDTRPLKPVSEWTAGAVPWKGSRSSSYAAFRRRSSPEAELVDPRASQHPPVRMIVGIENDASLWHRSIRNIAETFWILPLNRHRPLQFVQWTLVSQPSHPIMLDVVRRIINRANLARALMLDRDARADAAEVAGKKSLAAKIRKEKMPWSGRNMRKSGIEEWTGPGAWTDAVFSYLGATAGISPKHLRGLRQPLQVGNVLILPADGFNPFKHRLPNPMARVLHLRRGSWKTST